MKWLLVTLVCLMQAWWADASAVAVKREDDGYEVQQVHIAQGVTPESMTISWVTKSPAKSQLKFGLNFEALNWFAEGTSSSYSFDYPQYGVYESGTIHHVQINNLLPGTTYFYVCGDFDAEKTSGTLQFETMLKVGDLSKPTIFGVIGDLGQTTDSSSTINHMTLNSNLKMILHAGDLSYADCNQPLWDSYGILIEDLAKARPWMVGPGNHEIELANDGSTYVAFEERYRMPAIRPAEIGAVTIPAAIDSTGKPYCCSSVFQSEYNWGNSFYSFETGAAHVIYLNPYSVSNHTSVQYLWLVSDLAKVDRTVTPWVIVVMHCPWYNSNTAHVNEQQTVLMRESMEELFYKNKVNLVISGHVHAYERSHPVYNNQVVRDGIVYITIGDAGNREGHASTYSDPQPEWSAFRNGTQYGHAELSLNTPEKLTWKWYRNVDGEVVFKDELTLCNSALNRPVLC